MYSYHCTGLVIRGGGLCFDTQGWTPTKKSVSECNFFWRALTKLQSFSLKLYSLPLSYSYIYSILYYQFNFHIGQHVFWILPFRALFLVSFPQRLGKSYRVLPFSSEFDLSLPLTFVFHFYFLYSALHWYSCMSPLPIFLPTCMHFYSQYENHDYNQVCI